MPKKSKKPKEPKKATKKIKQTVKQSVKQSVVVKIGDIPKKKRKYTRKQAPAVKAPAPERQSTSLQPTIYNAPVQPISRLDPNNQAMNQSIQQFDKMSQSINDALQQISRTNLIQADKLSQSKMAIALEEGVEGGLVQTETQLQKPFNVDNLQTTYYNAPIIEELDDVSPFKKVLFQEAKKRGRKGKTEEQKQLEEQMRLEAISLKKAEKSELKEMAAQEKEQRGKRNVGRPPKAKESTPVIAEQIFADPLTALSTGDLLQTGKANQIMK